MNRLKQYYQETVVPALLKETGRKNPFAVPHITKVVLNMGVSDPQDPRAREKIMANLVEQFRAMTGQHAQVTKAKKAIATFKLRQGDPLGVMVTLRGQLMWEFLDKLVSITLPRVKDFRGVPLNAFDGQGNYSLGLSEQIVFPEIEYDKIERTRGLQINIVTTLKSDEESRSLLRHLGMPFEKVSKEK